MFINVNMLIKKNMWLDIITTDRDGNLGQYLDTCIVIGIDSLMYIANVSCSVLI